VVVIYYCIPTKKEYDLEISYDEKYIEESINTKVHSLQIDKHLNWKNHIDLMIPKLIRACYAIRSMSHISSLFPFHNEMWNNFWGNSLNSKMIFTLQRRTVRIIAGVKSRTSCRNLFVSSEILPVA